MPTETLTTALMILRSGGIIAMPTDTVYGLHCAPNHLDAIEKILSLKQRDPSKGLILIADQLERFNHYIQPLPEAIANKLRHHPGITWLVPAKPGISKLITGNFNTVAIRICQQPLIAQLSALLNLPLISTSANISNYPVAKNAQEIKKFFPKGVDLIIEGNVAENATASEIHDAFTDQRLR